ncbi:hypothetical protein [Streptomyces sp. NPDC055189]
MPAVTHTRSPEITVEITLTDDEAAVSVGDCGPHRHLRAEHAAADAEDGRGLLIVEALAGCWEQSRDDVDGTIVHTAITLPDIAHLPVPAYTSRMRLRAGLCAPDVPWLAVSHGPVWDLTVGGIVRPPDQGLSGRFTSWSGGVVSGAWHFPKSGGESCHRRVDESAGVSSVRSPAALAAVAAGSGLGA